MANLSEHIHIAALAGRSVNLERDAESSLAGYIPTARSVDTVRRVLDGLLSRSGNHAWSVTGPYGSGKSSFALLLDSLAGPRSKQRQNAVDLLDPIAPELVKLSDELLGDDGTWG